LCDLGWTLAHTVLPFDPLVKGEDGHVPWPENFTLSFVYHMQYRIAYIRDTYALTPSTCGDTQQTEGWL